MFAQPLSGGDFLSEIVTYNQLLDEIKISIFLEMAEKLGNAIVPS